MWLRLTEAWDRSARRGWEGLRLEGSGLEVSC